MLRFIKKQKIKIILVIMLIFTFLYSVNDMYAANEVTKKLYQDITINSDGSITVKEAAILGGIYNGREREIEFKNRNATTFTGIYSNFSGSTDIYNGSEITDIKIYDISKSEFKTIDDIHKIEKIYKKVESADKGKYGVYTLSKNSYGVDFRIFCPSSKNKVFVMEYIIKDVVVVHNDVAEFYWNVLGDNYREKIEDFQVMVHLPGNDTDLRVWTHGPLTGVNEILDSKTVYFKDTNINARNAETIRIMFDNNLVPDATKYSGVNGKAYILQYEQKMADAANAQREKNKLEKLNKIEDLMLKLEQDARIYYYNEILDLIKNLNIADRKSYLLKLDEHKEKVNESWKKDIEDEIKFLSKDNFNNLNEYAIKTLTKKIDEGFDTNAKQEFLLIVEELKVNLEKKYAKIRRNSIYIVSIVFSFVSTIIIAKLLKLLNEKNTYSGKYYRDFPSEDNPYVIEYLMKRKITNISFSATILSLISKKVIKIEKIHELKKDNIRLILANEGYIGTKAEIIVLDVLFNLVGNNR